MKTVVIILVLILLNGLFAMSEIAMVTARRPRLAAEAKRGSRSARTALGLASDPDRFLSTVQIGITLIGILTGIYSGDALAPGLARMFTRAGMGASYALPVAQVLIVLAVTYLTIIFGELVPKRIGLAAAERMAKLVAPLMKVLSIAAAPFVWLLSRSSSLVFRIIGLKDSGGKVTEEDIRTMVQEGAETGEVQPVEQDIVQRVFSLGDRNVESIMTHRSRIVWLDLGMKPQEIDRLVRGDLYEVYPAARGSLDRVEGVVFLKDLFGRLSEPGFRLEQVLRPVQFVHEHTPVYAVLEQMRTAGEGYGLVFDEYGGLQGIVTLKDVLEGLVGAVDEADENPEIVRQSEGCWQVDGRCPYYDFAEELGPDDVPAGPYNTVSGLALDLFGRIPRVGEQVRWGRYLIEVSSMDGARIDRLLVCRLPAED